MMKNFITFLIIALLFPFGLAFAFSSSEIINHEAPQAFIFTKEFDKLVLDVTLPSGNQGQSDALEAFVVQSEGTARNLTDVYKFILWQDKGKQGFQGMGIDEKIGEFSFWNENYSWHLNDLEVTIPPEGLRFFVSAEISSGPTSDKFLKMKIPALLDHNGNGNYDLGDLGIFLQSSNNGPEGGSSLNQYAQTIRTFTFDNLPPKAVITDPLDDSTEITTSYTVKGMARDQGNSTVQWVKLGIEKAGELIWHDVATDNEYLNWQYEWQDISAETYTLKTKSADRIGNQKESEEITFTVAEIVQEPEEETPEETEQKTEGGQEPLSEIELLQQQINDLLSQIANLQSQIAGSVTDTPSFSTIPSNFTFNNALKLGMTGDEIKYLQIVLNSDSDTQLAASGIGSSGNETTYFGPLTKVAVIKFQEKYSSEILSPWNLSSGTGFVGGTTRAKLNEVLGR